MHDYHNQQSDHRYCNVICWWPPEKPLAYQAGSHNSKTRVNCMNMLTHCGLVTSVRFLRRPVGPRPATLLSGLQLQKRVGPVGRQLLYLICWAEWSTNVNGYWRNKILFKRYTFIYDLNQHYPEMCTLITRGIEIVSASSIKEIKVLP